MLKTLVRAIRSLTSGSSRMSTSVALLTLALAFGATISALVIVEAVLLRPLPFQAARSLVNIHLLTERNQPHTANVALYRQWSEASTGLASLAGYAYLPQVLRGSGQAELISTVTVSSSMFPLLGWQPLMGRGFLPAEDLRSTSPVVILSNRFWRTRFGSDSAVIGRTVALNDRMYEIVGVMPAGFRVPLSIPEVRKASGEVWIPLGSYEDLMSRFPNPPLNLIGRLSPDVSFTQVTGRLETAGSGVLPPSGSSQEMRVEVKPVRDVLTGEIRGPLFILVAGVCLIFLIAVANVSTLQLAHATQHEHDSAIRFTLGAARRQVVAPILAEALILAFAAAGLGTLLALWAAPTLVAVYGPRFPDVGPVGLNATVIVGSVVLAALAGLLIGIVPAMKVRESARLSGYGHSAPGRYGAFARSKTAATLVVSQVALTLVLTTATGLLLASFLTLTRSDRGYDGSQTAIATLTLPPQGYGTLESTLNFTDNLLQRAEALPGVEAAAISTGVPVVRGRSETGRDAAQPDRELVTLQTWEVSPNYFRLLGIPLVRGQSLPAPGTSDDAALVDGTAARDLFGADLPLGKRIALGNGGRALTVVGVVGDVKEFAFGQSEATASLFEPHIYMSLRGLESPIRRMYLLVNSSQPPSELLRPIRATVGGIDPEILVEVSTLQEMKASLANRERTLAIAAMGFGGLALLLTVSGVFALVTYSTSLRVREIGLRMALGGQRPQVLLLVLRQGLGLTAWGVLLGFPLALAVRPVLAAFLVEVSSMHGEIAVVASLAILLAGVAASYFPARRATRVDPLTALKADV